jgi:hypothetical protein
MTIQVCMGAMLMCSFGTTPSTLVVVRPQILSVMSAATILDNVPFLNILPFGMCMSLANPTVAAATAAALGVLTPMPCIPVTPAPWVPGQPKVLIQCIPALTNCSLLMCAYGGVIQICNPGQFKVFV